MKQLVYSQVSGRRQGDTEVKWRLDPWKIIGGLLGTSLLAWGTWVTVNCFKAEKADEKINLQTTVLHNRITDLGLQHEADETRLEDRIYRLQARFFENELKQQGTQNGP